MSTQVNPETDLRRIIAGYTHDPLRFAQFCWPASSPLPWQRDVLDYIGSQLRSGASARGPIQIAVASGHGIGKSALVSWLILWGLATCVDTRGVVTANTAAQLQTKTWAELGKWHQLAPIRHWVTLKAESISCSDDAHTRTWRIDQIPWSITRTEAFAGLHNQGRRILLIFDEASAIPDSVWEVAEGALTDQDTEIIWAVFGNPTQNTGRFRECFGRLRHRWHTRQVDSRTVSITNKSQINQWINDYGEDSDFVRVRVKGQFPRASSSQLIPSDIVEAARKATPISWVSDPVVIGVDVARYGDDQSVIAIRQGLDARSRPWRAYRGLDTMQLSGEVASVASDIARQGIRVHAIFVDGVGVGAGVVDRLRELGYPVIDVQAGRQSPDRRYHNLRAKMWCEMRDWLNRGGAIPDNQMLADDLTGPQYGYQSDSRLQLERKDDMRRRGLSSPDHADALAMTFAMPIGPDVTAIQAGHDMADGYDYDPYDYL